jgi:hypothetical protein
MCRVTGQSVRCDRAALTLVKPTGGQYDRDAHSIGNLCGLTWRIGSARREALLVQLGLLDSQASPVVGAESAARLLDRRKRAHCDADGDSMHAHSGNV